MLFSLFRVRWKEGESETDLGLYPRLRVALHSSGEQRRTEERATATVIRYYYFTKMIQYRNRCNQSFNI